MYMFTVDVIDVLHKLTPQVSWPMANTYAIQKDT